MVTLHHFVHPNWFETLGGFTKEANIPIFVEFAKTAFRYSSATSKPVAVRESTAHILLIVLGQSSRLHFTNTLMRDIPQLVAKSSKFKCSVRSLVSCASLSLQWSC